MKTILRISGYAFLGFAPVNSLTRIYLILFYLATYDKRFASGSKNETSKNKASFMSHLNAMALPMSYSLIKHYKTYSYCYPSSLKKRLHGSNNLLPRKIFFQQNARLIRRASCPLFQPDRELSLTFVENRTNYGGITITEHAQYPLSTLTANLVRFDN